MDKNCSTNISKRLNLYLLNNTNNNTNNNENDIKLNKLKYTVIRLYFHNLIKLCYESKLNKSQLDKVRQLKILINNNIIDGTVYDFPERIPKVLSFLYDICKNDNEINLLINEYDTITMYF